MNPHDAHASRAVSADQKATDRAAGDLSMPERTLVFIVGEPRSGTTWMMWLLARHPAVTATFHGSLFHSLEPLWQWWTKDAHFSKTVFTYTGDEQSPFSKKRLNHLLSPDEFFERSQPLVSYVFDRIASCGPDTRVVVEDTPENLEFLPWVLRILPQAYVLHVIRDPRSVFASQRAAAYSWARDERITASPVQAARSWQRYMKLGQEIAAITPRYREVHYETLLADGATELQKIFAWLGVPADDAICQAAVAGASVEEMRRKKLPKGFVRQGSAEGWRSELSRSEIRTIEYVAGDEMKRLGYACTLQPAGKPFQVWRHDASIRAARRVRTLMDRRRIRRLLKRVPVLQRTLEALLQTRESVS